MEAFKRHVMAGRHKDGLAFVTIKWDGKRLSITGVIGPKANGDATGSCGQCVGSIRESEDCEGSIDAEQRARLVSEWDRWHLNDMRAGCEHQRAAGWGSESLEVVTYGINGEAWNMKREAEAEAMSAAREGRAANLTEAGRFLVGPDWFKDRFTPPDTDSPLSGLFDVKKRETRLSGWVRPNEHPRGVLCKPCPECGHRYGTAWLLEEVPEEVLSFLRSLPETSAMPQRWAS